MMEQQFHTTGPLCKRPGCGKLAWNGNPGEYCARSCMRMCQYPQPYKCRAQGCKYTPRCNEILMDDPRSNGFHVGVVAFYNPGKEEPCDVICQAGFLGNFYESSDVLSLMGLQFTNSEAAFQSLKYFKSGQASRFQNLSGHDAFRLKTALGYPDFTYGGFGSNWKGMRAVLDAKFANPECAKLLQKTGDTFLLEHNSKSGRDCIWSDNYDGTGTNWLGIQLMLVRDKQNNLKRWTTTIGGFIDLDSGKPWNESRRQQWQDIVYAANMATMNRLTPKPLHSFITELDIEDATEAKPIKTKPATMKTNSKRKYGETITDGPTPGVKEEPTEVRFVPKKPNECPAEKKQSKQNESKAQGAIHEEAKECPKKKKKKKQKKQNESKAQVSIQEEAKESPKKKEQKKQTESKAQGTIQEEATESPTEKNQKKHKESKAQGAIQEEANESSTEKKQKKQKKSKAQGARQQKVAEQAPKKEIPEAGD